MPTKQAQKLKFCGKCRTSKIVTEFAQARDRYDGVQGQCKDCTKLYRERNAEKLSATNIEYKRENAERIKEQRVGYREKKASTIARQVLERKLRNRYGITYSLYQLMLGLQEGRCAICKGFNNYAHGEKRLHVDHDHETGKVRGLLCQKCNQALGSFKENIETLQAAVTYLKNHGKR